MNKSLILLLGVALSVGPIASAAEVAVSTTTSGGTITEFTPGSAISVRTESATAPVRYVVGDTVTYVDEAGATVSPEIVRTGVPVTVHYVKEGDRMIARRVVVKKTTTTTTTAPVAVEERRTTTTTTAPAPVVEERRSSTTTTTTKKSKED